MVGQEKQLSDLHKCRLTMSSSKSHLYMELKPPKIYYKSIFSLKYRKIHIDYTIIAFKLENWLSLYKLEQFRCDATI